MTFKVKINGIFDPCCLSAIYHASTNANRSKKLWRSLKNVHNTISGPWAVCGDLMLSWIFEEKKGGRPHTLAKSLDFMDCMQECDLMDTIFTGNKFTWCNGRRRRWRISKRLDRVITNDDWYLNFWSEQEGYSDIIKEVWDQQI
ncbi:uncharacterized protein LOC132031770 [Lycium ferocissimum]|uniref:uncharacterized protein LOC132031770 n=1 Tax=Lycium ferocissimum TaxID=112874 RepID=UPI00281590D8|nr:uncharacterized protein LOC132031770 [Lycium ferocissimum]